MTEGKGSKTFSIAKKLLYTDPQFAHALLDKITLSTIAYLKAQIAAGAAMVQLFDVGQGYSAQVSTMSFRVGISPAFARPSPKCP